MKGGDPLRHGHRVAARVHPRLTTPYIGHRRREIGGARRWNALIDAMEPPFGAAPQ